ncbi:MULTISPECIES: AAA family ATPase [unclassified Devosia]|uniref:ATP-binding protein n=1 Tax=unclassified Devosia TaxID=196773 RepID=UPI0015527225|nr:MULTISPECIES: AAA family ATPase [unclassified Devosia]
MRLRRLDLLRYGKFTDFSLDFGAHEPGTPDLHIIYGLNEAGKSTSLSAYLDLLFGIEERSRYNFLHPYPSMEIGGVLEFNDENHALRRVKGRANSLRDNRGQPVTEALLSTPLAGLTRDAYRMMFSLDDQTLEDGGNAILESRGDLGELLFSASTGLADIGRILEGLKAEADGIYRKSASSTQIAVHKRQLAELKTKRDQIDVQASAHNALVAELDRATRAYEEISSELGRARAEHEALSRIARAFPLAQDHARLTETLAKLEDLPRPPAHWGQELPGLMHDETRLQTRNAELEGRAKRLRAEIEAIAVDGAVLALAEPIEALADAAARFRTAEDDLPKRRQTLLEQQARISAITRSLGRADQADARALLIPAPVAGTLRDLIEQRSGIDALLATAEQEVTAAQLAFEAAEQEQQALLAKRPSLDPSTLANLQAGIAAARQSDLSARERIHARELPRLQREFDGAMAALLPWSGTADDLAGLTLPTVAQISQWRSGISEAEARATRHRENQRELLARQTEQLNRIKHLRAAGAIDDTEAANLRAERDAAWGRHLEQLDRDSALQFAATMTAADQMTDARIANAQATVEMRSLSAELTSTEARLAQEEAQLEEAAAELETLRSAPRASLPADLDQLADTATRQLLDDIDNWRTGVERARAALATLDGATAALSDTRAELTRERDELAQALTATGADTSALSVPALLQSAENALNAVASAQAASESADKLLRERERELLARRRVRDAALGKQADWQNRWDRTVEETWFADQAPSTGAVRAILDALAELGAELRHREETEHRIAAMERDQAAFRERVAELHNELKETFEPAQAPQLAGALAQRSRQARQSLQRRMEKAGELEALQAELGSLAQELRVCEAKKGELLEFFAAEDLAGVAAALAQCAERDRLEHEQAKLAARIVGEMNVSSLETALNRLADIDRTALDETAAVLAARLEDLDERRRMLFAERSMAQERLAAVGGDDAVARIEAERRTLLLQIEELALRFVRLRAGGLVAEHALHAYREQHRSSMMQRASQAFQLITRNEYTGLTTRAEKDGEALIGLARGGGSKLATDMSKGTRFQLYLALRLAGYAEFAAVRPSVPFIADDIMETFDEPRSEEVFRLFAQMAIVGQVIYLTHHRHLCDIAQQVVPGVRIHQIAS